MPGGRQKKTDKLSHAEISRRSRNKRKQEDPEGLRKRENAKNKRHYDKKKNADFKFKKQKNSLISYYKNIQVKKPFLKFYPLKRMRKMIGGLSWNLISMVNSE